MQFFSFTFLSGYKRTFVDNTCNVRLPLGLLPDENQNVIDNIYNVIEIYRIAILLHFYSY